MLRNRMLNLDQISRRRFVTAAAKSLLGVGLAPLVGRSLADHTPLDPMLRRRASSVIYINLMGGMSHLDTFDPKPESPDVQGPVKPLFTNVPGIIISEFLPGMSSVMDKVVVLRSMTSNQGDHPAAQYLLHRSHLQGGTLSHPTLAAWALRALDKLNPNLPGSISIAGNEDSVSAGFLEARYAPLPIGDPAQGLPHARRPANVDDATFQRRLALTQELNQEFHASFEYRDVRAHANMFSEAVRLMGSRDLNAFDISREPAIIHESYGGDPFGQGCMLARRLAEHGVRFIEVGLGGWDTHFDNFGVVADRATVLDRGLSALLKDLDQRGMLESTLLVVGTEFGRTPQITPVHQNGRDHHPQAFTCLLAGAGIQSGHAFGATDRQGMEVASNPLSIPDLNATIAWALGISTDEEFATPSGQLFRIADDGEPLTQLF